MSIEINEPRPGNRPTPCNKRRVLQTRRGDGAPLNRESAGQGHQTKRSRVGEVESTVTVIRNPSSALPALGMSAAPQEAGRPRVVDAGGEGRAIGARGIERGEGAGAGTQEAVRAEVGVKIISGDRPLRVYAGGNGAFE
jgi:hypothetical protein